MADVKPGDIVTGYIETTEKTEEVTGEVSSVKSGYAYVKRGLMSRSIPVALHRIVQVNGQRVN